MIQIDLPQYQRPSKLLETKNNKSIKDTLNYSEKYNEFLQGQDYLLKIGHVMIQLFCKGVFIQ